MPNGTIDIASPIDVNGSFGSVATHGIDAIAEASHSDVSHSIDHSAHSVDDNNGIYPTISPDIHQNASPETASHTTTPTDMPLATPLHRSSWHTQRPSYLRDYHCNLAHSTDPSTSMTKYPLQKSLLLSIISLLYTVCSYCFCTNRAILLSSGYSSSSMA